jgi:hypothetical protein
MVVMSRYYFTCVPNFSIKSLSVLPFQNTTHGALPSACKYLYIRECVRVDVLWSTEKLTDSLIWACIRVVNSGRFFFIVNTLYAKLCTRYAYYTIFQLYTSCFKNHYRTIVNEPICYPVGIFRRLTIAMDDGRKLVTGIMRQPMT